MKKVLFVFLVLCLSGCGFRGGQYHADKNKSFGLNLANSAGISGMHVVDREVVPVAASKNSASQGSGFGRTAGVAVETYTGLSSPLSFLGQGGTGALGLLSALSSPKEIDKNAYSSIIAYLPKKEAETEDEAIQLFYDSVKKAMKFAYLQVYKQEPKTTVIISSETPEIFYYMDFMVSGDSYCDEIGAKCIHRVYQGNDSADSIIAPDFLGGYPAWAFDWYDRGKIQISISTYAEQKMYFTSNTRLVEAHVPALDDITYWLAVSSYLPDWAYIYLGPGGASLGPKKGYLGEPLVLHQGQIHRFIIPAAAKVVPEAPGKETASKQ